jgi:cysteinyl-tRNA synthetase
VRQYAEKYEQAFLEDARLLDLEPPEKLVRATEHIPQMAHFIRELEKKQFAYRSEDGSYYFRIARFPEYGKLSKKDFAGIETGVRVDVDEYEKDNARDFALWKSPKPGEAKWETELGEGRPGWHIECSVMAMEYLGDTLDLHAGGEDLIFPHHENEVAQSEAKSGKPFSRYWLHVRFLLVEGEKMSKSLGNFYTLRDLILKGHKPSSIRYLLSSVPYRKQLNFTFDGLRQAAAAVERLRNFRDRLKNGKFLEGSNPKIAELARETKSRFAQAMEDDLNTAEGLGVVFEMLRQANAALDANEVHAADVPALQQVLEGFDEIFDVLTDRDAEKLRSTVEWAKAEGKEVSGELAALLKEQTISDHEIEALIAQRNEAKKNRDFKRADTLRQQLMEKGIILEDTKEGVRWKRK